MKPWPRIWAKTQVWTLRTTKITFWDQNNGKTIWSGSKKIEIEKILVENFFWWPKKNLGRKKNLIEHFFEIEFFLVEIFFGDRKFLDQNFFWPKIFFGTKFFFDRKFFDRLFFFGSNNFLDRTIFWIVKKNPRKKVRWSICCNFLSIGSWVTPDYMGETVTHPWQHWQVFTGVWALYLTL